MCVNRPVSYKYIPESVKLIFYLKPAHKMQVIYIENIIGKQQFNVFIKNLFPKAVSNVVHTLAESLLGWNAPRNSKGSLIKLLVIINFLHSLIIRFAHAEHADVCKDDISILNLVLGTILSHIHVVKFFGEIVFAK